MCACHIYGPGTCEKDDVRSWVGKISTRLAASEGLHALSVRCHPIGKLLSRLKIKALIVV